MGKIRLGSLLVEAGLVDETQLATALNIQNETGRRLGEILVENKMVGERELVNILSEQMGFPIVEVDTVDIAPEIPTIVKENLARRHILMPLKMENGRIVVAMADPLNIYAIDDIQMTTGCGVVPYIAGKKEIMRAIDRYYGQQSTEAAVEDLLKEMSAGGLDVLDERTLNEINNAPLVRLVNSLLRQAVTMRASDVHIEPYDTKVRVRFRIDGDLQEIMKLEINTHSAVVARIKIMGKMDIAERRVPQDGRVEMKIEDHRVDLRLSTLPTVYGEKVVVRILDRSGKFLNRDELGFSPQSLDILDSVVRHPYGIILVTGPTGCGKTSTLYTILSELNSGKSNIITVEDPVEYRVSGVNQVQVNPKAGVTFANALRSILRQDPDIIMIGEIRDTETVEIAVRAAITGHLVLSTMHTNDTASTITRLLDMGIEPYLISSSLVGVVSQRLVKKICPDCRIEYQADESELKMFGMEKDEKVTLYKGSGCVNCNSTGYMGRTAVTEIMEVNLQIKKRIDERSSLEDIKNAALENGMVSLQHSCREMVLNGTTTVEEYIRNTYIID
ncbi:MAG: ATPase, T2SS/T4P/T4SS family [Clostridia bacterium]|nr:ATPase, T2SS/T4P/T4SS family [Clostridia bacterium]